MYRWILNKLKLNISIHYPTQVIAGIAIQQQHIISEVLFMLVIDICKVFIVIILTVLLKAKLRINNLKKQINLNI